MKTLCYWAIRLVAMILAVILACIAGWLFSTLFVTIVGPLGTAYTIVILGFIALTILLAIPAWWCWCKTVYPLWCRFDQWLMLQYRGAKVPTMAAVL